MYQPHQQATTEDMRAIGLPIEAVGQFDVQDTTVWELHWPAVELFAAMSTQWRVGMAGATGLDYAALPAVFDLYDVPKGQRRERMDEIRIMEREALAVIAERKH